MFKAPGVHPIIWQKDMCVTIPQLWTDQDDKTVTMKDNKAASKMVVIMIVCRCCYSCNTVRRCSCIGLAL